jgi:sugar lactone lactonase YvrE
MVVRLQSFQMITVESNRGNLRRPNDLNVDSDGET